jgi:hypothetical protein
VRGWERGAEGGGRERERERERERVSEREGERGRDCFCRRASAERHSCSIPRVFAIPLSLLPPPLSLSYPLSHSLYSVSSFRAV